MVWSKGVLDDSVLEGLQLYYKLCFEYQLIITRYQPMLEDTPAEPTIFYPVDSSVPNHDSFQVFMEGDRVYHGSLRQENYVLDISRYYVIQLLQRKGSKVLSLWCRWGHEGSPGKNMMIPIEDKQDGIGTFEKKYQARIKAGYNCQQKDDQ